VASNYIGQWSEPPKGGIEDDMAGCERKRSSEIINLSSLEAICEAHPLLLF